MAFGPDEGPVEAGKSIYQTTSEVVLTGIAIIIPIVVTVYVLQVALSFVENALQPVVEFLAVTGVFAFLEGRGLIGFLIDTGLYDGVIGVLSELIALLALTAIILLVGSIAYHPQGERLVAYFDGVVASIPGVGTVYRSFRRMGDIMLDDEVDNFQEVKLVELFGEGAYTIGFKVGRSPPNVRGSVGDDVVTMFIPFAPNPVTGGVLTYVSEDRLADVDMTVEEGIRNVITSGVAGHESESAHTDVDLSIDDLPTDVVDPGEVQNLLDGDTYLPNGPNEGRSSSSEPGSSERSSAESQSDANATGEADGDAESTTERRFRAETDPARGARRRDDDRSSE